MTATISVPGEAAARAAAATFPVTTSEVFELRTRMRIVSPLGEGRLEVDLGLDRRRQVERGFDVVEVLEHQPRGALGVARSIASTIAACSLYGQASASGAS